MKLKAMSVEAGERISSVWEPANRVTARMVCTQGCKLKTCAGTLSACCLAFPGADGESPQDFLSEQVEVALQNVWITGIANQDPLYWACALCSTKIDPVSGLCKKAGPAHITIAQDEKVALTTVRVADASGSCADVLARTEAILTFAGVQTVNELDALIQCRSAEAITMQGRFDIVLGANQVRKALGKGKGFDQHGKASDPQSQGYLECRFEVLRAARTLLDEWDTDDRPALAKVLESKSSPNTGNVFPVRCPVSDLMDTAGRVKVRHTTVFPSFIMVLGLVKQQPREQTIGEGEDALVELVHESVYPQECLSQELPAGFQPTAKAFSVEIICDPQGPGIQAARMIDEVPYLIVGRPQLDDQGNVTIMANNIFDLRNIPDAEERFKKEREGWWELLQHKVEQHETKRSAKDLITNTPSKKRCMSGGA